MSGIQPPTFPGQPPEPERRYSKTNLRFWAEVATIVAALAALIGLWIGYESLQEQKALVGAETPELKTPEIGNSELTPPEQVVHANPDATAPGPASTAGPLPATSASLPGGRDASPDAIAPAVSGTNGTNETVPETASANTSSASPGFRLFRELEREQSPEAVPQKVGGDVSPPRVDAPEISKGGAEEVGSKEEGQSPSDKPEITVGGDTVDVFARQLHKFLR